MQCGSGRSAESLTAKVANAQSPTAIFTNDRTHVLRYQWVGGDPRRDGRIGVAYAVDPQLQTFLAGFGFPVPVIETDGGGIRLSSQSLRVGPSAAGRSRSRRPSAERESIS